ncbi:hypothetical protein V6N13_074597 [Hibiscus sabdariffa]
MFRSRPPWIRSVLNRLSSSTTALAMFPDILSLLVVVCELIAAKPYDLVSYPCTAISSAHLRLVVLRRFLWFSLSSSGHREFVLPSPSPVIAPPLVRPSSLSCRRRTVMLSLPPLTLGVL